MSAYMTASQFKEQYPTFSELSDARVQTWLNLAKSMVNAAEFGDRATLAHGLKTAHLLAISPDGVDTYIDIGELTDRILELRHKGQRAFVVGSVEEVKQCLGI